MSDPAMPRLVTCPSCNRERLAMTGDAAICADCRRNASTLRLAVASLKVSHPSLAVQLRQMAERIERTD